MCLQLLMDTELMAILWLRPSLPIWIRYQIYNIKQITVSKKSNHRKSLCSQKYYCRVSTINSKKRSLKQPNSMPNIQDLLQSLSCLKINILHVLTLGIRGLYQQDKVLFDYISVDKKSWEVIYLSQDQKPSVEAEKKRILKYGGRIQALLDERGESVGPLRVWLPNQSEFIFYYRCSRFSYESIIRR